VCGAKLQDVHEGCYQLVNMAVEGWSQSQHSVYQSATHYVSLSQVLMQRTRNSSGDKIANVNFFHDDTVHVLQNITGCWIFNTTQAVVPWEWAWYYWVPLQPRPCLQLQTKSMPEYDLATGEILTLMPSLGVILCEYHHKWYIATRNVGQFPTWWPPCQI